MQMIAIIYQVISIFFLFFIDAYADLGQRRFSFFIRTRFKLSFTSIMRISQMKEDDSTIATARFRSTNIKRYIYIYIYLGRAELASFQTI